MAKDLLFGRTKTNWGRGAAPTAAGSEECVEKTSHGPGIIGISVSLMFASRILTGKWPWYWFRHVDRRLGSRE